MYDPKRKVGLSPRKQALLAKTEDLTPEEINQQRLAIKNANKRNRSLKRKAR